MKNPISAIDSLLAATALHHDLRLVTRLVKDFTFPSLQVYAHGTFKSYAQQFKKMILF